MKSKSRNWIAKEIAAEKAQERLEELERPIDEPARDAARAMQKLTNLAEKGDARAGLAIVRHLGVWIHQLERIESMHPELLEAFRASASERIVWPGFISIDKDWQRDEANRIALLKLGAKAAWNYRGRKQWTSRTPETHVALQLASRLIRERAGGFPPSSEGLPKFTKATSPKYYKAAKPLLLRYYGEDFENHPVFAQYRNHRSVLDQDTLSPATAARRLILTKLRQSFRTIAPA